MTDSMRIFVAMLLGVGVAALIGNLLPDSLPHAAFGGIMGFVFAGVFIWASETGEN
jgi:hypothetical protein